jgi:hypothetical protein
MHAVRTLLDALSASGGRRDRPPSASWDERQAVVRKEFFDSMGDRYSVADPTVATAAQPSHG